ncbi:MAG TPA: HEPN domain-containing protein [Kofleriaceae bacterium]|nr:HEPN domain-containing protein [Kofleriaceae bacterium]
MLRIASQDLDGARLLSAAGNRNAAYLCEQAAEKVIRAVLTSEGVQAGIRHELPDMVDKIPDENPMKPVPRAIEHLAAYATAFRYPSPRGRIRSAPAQAELEDDIAKIAAALSAAVAAFQVDLSKLDAPARKAEPIR